MLVFLYNRNKYNNAKLTNSKINKPTTLFGLCCIKDEKEIVKIYITRNIDTSTTKKMLPTFSRNPNYFRTKTLEMYE